MSENGTAEQMAMPKHGEFCWTEIATANLETCKTFYTEIFGWNFHESDNPDTKMQYLEFGIGNGCGVGGMYQPTAEMCGGTIPPPHFMNYIAVDDIDEATSKAFDLGGKIVVPPMEIPHVGRFSVVEDPAGAKFAMITLKQPGGEK
ncbi:MAG TPA: VOC family protein [Pyrinomonadaceae bacterium]|jgi:predicted enzyme related to lactoylglutathione lyase